MISPTTSPRLRRATAAAVVSVIVFGAPTIVSAAPQPTVEELTTQARAVAAELADMQARTSRLDEEYNSTLIQLEHVREQGELLQDEVADARAELDGHRQVAKQYAIDAYVGGHEDDDPLLAQTDDTADLSRRSAYLTVLNGDRQQLIDDVSAAQDDLSVREDELAAIQSRIEAEMTTLEQTKRELEAAVAQQTELSASIRGRLAEAVAAEQARVAEIEARAAERRARAAAEAAAEAAERRTRADAPTTSSVPVASSGSTTATATTSGSTTSTSQPTTAPPTTSAPAPTSQGQIAVQAALSQQGVPYRWAGASPSSGFDCSGLIQWAYAQAGRSLPHSSRSLYSMTRRVSADQLRPGDLVFGGSPVHHVGMYIGNGQMVHAPHTGDVVRVADMYSSSKPVSFGAL